MEVTRRDAERIFNKLDVEPVASSHHVTAYIVVGGMRVLRVHYSFGRGPMPPSIGHKFRRSLHLSVDEFVRLRDCPMSREEYFTLLLDRIPNDSGLDDAAV